MIYELVGRPVGQSVNRTVGFGFSGLAFLFDTGLSEPGREGNPLYGFGC